MPANEESAVSQRYKQELGNLARHRLAICPDYQAEAIARHYASHATLALELLKPVELRRQSAVFHGDDNSLNHTIEMLVGQIKNNHWHDFGIELDWKGNL